MRFQSHLLETSEGTRVAPEHKPTKHLIVFMLPSTPPLCAVNVNINYPTSTDVTEVCLPLLPFYLIPEIFSAVLLLAP